MLALQNRRFDRGLGVGQRFKALIRRGLQEFVVRRARRIVRVVFRRKIDGISDDRRPVVLVVLGAPVLLAARIFRERGRTRCRARVEVGQAEFVPLGLHTDRGEATPLNTLRTLRDVEQARLEVRIARDLRWVTEAWLGNCAELRIDDPRVLNAVVEVRTIGFVEETRERTNFDAIIDFPRTTAGSRPLVVDRGISRLFRPNRIGPRLANQVFGNIAARVAAPNRNVGTLVREELIPRALHLRVRTELALQLEEGLIGEILEVDVDRAARRVALLVGREGLADLQALDDRTRELIELHGAALGVRRWQTHAVEQCGDVAIGKTAHDCVSALLHRRARNQEKRRRCVTCARLADDVGANRIEQLRTVESKCEQRRFTPAEFELLDDEFVHVLVLAHEFKIERR